jgi:hypothetical protein
MDGTRAFELLQIQEYFNEAEARALADAFGVAWSGGASYTFRHGQLVYTRQALESSFKTATRCRPLGGVSTR